jgi:tetrahydromethanopterin S-methyltransferase subunit B
MPIPAGFSDQANDPNSPVYLDQTEVNRLFTLPLGVHPGIQSFAYTLGVRPQDLFGICLGLFLCVIAATIGISLFLWFVDWALANIIGMTNHRRQLKGSRGWTKEIQNDSNQDFQQEYEGAPHTGGAQRAQPRAFTTMRWWKYRLGLTSFHRDALIGNLVRILVLFHLPITVFSTFQFARPWGEGTVLSVVLAVFSFLIFSLLIPAALIFRLTTMKTNKLYDDTRTLLAYGPLYNQYASGSQTFAKLFFLNNVVFGLVVGCGQRSGTAQAIIVLILEVRSIPIL